LEGEVLIVKLCLVYADDNTVSCLLQSVECMHCCFETWPIWVLSGYVLNPLLCSFPPRKKGKISSPTIKSVARELIPFMTVEPATVRPNSASMQPALARWPTQSKSQRL